MAHLQHPARLGSLFAVSLVIGSALSSAALAQQTMYVAGYGGSFERLMRNDIIPPFEKANNVKVEYVAGQSTATLAKLQAQRGKQEIDIAIVDDGPMYQAVQFGFCAPIEKAPVLDDVYPIAKLDEKAIAFGIGVTSPVYNAKIFKEKGWPVPTSWGDLGNSAYKGQLALLGAASTTGLHGLIMVARAEGGGEAKIDPGFVAFRDKIRPNILTFAPSAPKLEELLQSGEIALTVISRSRAVALKKEGLPLEVAEPKEGAGALMVTMCPVVDSDVAPQSQKFIQHMLSPAMQKIFAGAGYGPVNRKTELTADEAAGLAVGDEAVAKLAKIDWPTVNQNRAAWTQRWNREIER
ncbi:ABC transporter substrate-binding protein [Bosea lathyri]|uniref:Putative spermidine/putrescine transport system substrate-binding protein n=1 Tax=Bosea lathyri TaxID=1036778 RepID=A0A1H5SC13_9HYPH|nr:ABC transporter substrate-binding protein [Bosea lathyri]SEF47351.1 putative spermidine/putrescine transport system substrate-binding protein [Bosea lathyri]